MTNVRPRKTPGLGVSGVWEFRETPVLHGLAESSRFDQADGARAEWAWLQPLLTMWCWHLNRRFARCSPTYSVRCLLAMVTWTYYTSALRKRPEHVDRKPYTRVYFPRILLQISGVPRHEGHDPQHSMLIAYALYGVAPRRRCGRVRVYHLPRRRAGLGLCFPLTCATATSGTPFPFYSAMFWRRGDVSVERTAARRVCTVQSMKG